MRRRVWPGAAMLILWTSGAIAADADAAFAQNCVLCHQTGGTGLPGQFPRLAGRVARISATPQGRTYLIELLTYGMTGTITVDGQEIFGLMPSFAHIPDEQLVDLLNYVQSLGDQPRPAPAPFTLDEVKAARAKPAKSAAEMLEQRQSLGLDKQVP